MRELQAVVPRQEQSGSTKMDERALRIVRQDNKAQQDAPGDTRRKTQDSRAQDTSHHDDDVTKHDQHQRLKSRHVHPRSSVRHLTVSVSKHRAARSNQADQLYGNNRSDRARTSCADVPGPPLPPVPPASVSGPPSVPLFRLPTPAPESSLPLPLGTGSTRVVPVGAPVWAICAASRQLCGFGVL